MGRFVVERDGSMGERRRRRASRDGLSTAAGHVCFVALPLIVTGVWAIVALRQHVFAGDFHYSFWPAGDRLLHGRSLYAATPKDLAAGIGFPYSPAAGLFFAPFALLPIGVADAVFALLNVVALVFSLRVLRVTDYRVFGAALLWVPVMLAWQLANVTLLLGLGIALIWRYRDRPVVSGILLGLLVSLKLFIWPVGLWLVATRRYVACGRVLACVIVVNTAALAVVGFDQISPYLRLVKAVTGIQELNSYNLIALGQLHGMGRTAAYKLQFAIAGLAAACCFLLGRRRHDVAAFTVSVALCLLFAPVVHLHYLALLVVPLALARPRLTPAWLFPVAMMVPIAVFPQHELVIVMATAVAVIAAALSRSSPFSGRQVAPPTELVGISPAAGVPHGFLEPIVEPPAR